MTSLHVKNRIRRALTLLELVIVLTIIVAIAGIAVAMFPRLLARAHVASCAANIPELLKAIQMYEAVSLDGYPDGMDTLVVGGDLADYLPRRNGQFDDLYVDQLDEGELEALEEAGIVRVTTMVANPEHPTYWPYDEGDPALTPLDDQMTLAFLDPARAQELGLSVDNVGTTGQEDGDRFVVFGLGSPTRMFGRTMNEAPAHFSDSMAGNPNDHYMRFVAVYQVGSRAWDSTAQEFTYQPLRRARLRAVLAIHPGKLEGVADHIEEYWEEVESDQLAN